MPEHQPQPGPYAQAARTYWDAGWHGVIPLPHGKKANPPSGWTGQDGAWPSYADIDAWAENPHPNEGGGNVALRLPHHVLGVDVDNYDDKPGAATVAEAEARWGELPPTWRTTSRDDGVSGIRLYRVPDGLAWPGELGDGTELIQTRHRYAVVWPSLHPQGRVYRWITPDGAISTVPPHVDDLPSLPDAWVEGLTRGELATLTERADLDLPAVGQWLAQGAPQGMCRRMNTAVQAALIDMGGFGSRHVAARTHALRVARLAHQHHTGVLDALSAVGGAFVAAVTDPNKPSPRDRRTAETEWANLVVGAVNLVSVDVVPDDGDPCDNPFSGLIAPTPTPAQESAPVVELRREVPLSSLLGTSPPALAAAPAVQPISPEVEMQRAQLLAQEMEIQRARRRAKRLLEEEEAAAAFREPPWLPTLTDELAEPDEPVAYAVDQVMPVGANVLLTAQYKAGKTTMVNHLAKCMADRLPFLGRYDVNNLGGRIALFNYEVDSRQYRRWMRDTGTENTDQISVLNLRGYRLPLVVPYVEDWVVRWLAEREIAVWIVDPLARAYVGSGQSENDNTEMGRFLDTLDVIKNRAGVSQLIMPTHTGRAEMEEGKERARGATRIDDWADVRWLLTKDDQEHRYFRATGRDVEIEEGRLEYDLSGRGLSYVGGSRAHKDDFGVSEAVVACITDTPGAGVNALRQYVRGVVGNVRNERVDEVCERLARAGRIRVEEGGAGRPKRHWINNYADLVETSA